MNGIIHESLARKKKKMRDLEIFHFCQLFPSVDLAFTSLKINIRFLIRKSKLVAMIESFSISAVLVAKLDWKNTHYDIFLGNAKQAAVSKVLSHSSN